MTTRPQQLQPVQAEALNTFVKKNADYGDAFSSYGPVGVLVRIGDKLARYINISNTQVRMVDTESLRDTLLDLHNYAAMAILLMDNPPAPK